MTQKDMRVDNYSHNMKVLVQFQKVSLIEQCIVWALSHSALLRVPGSWSGAGRALWLGWVSGAGRVLWLRAGLKPVPHASKEAFSCAKSSLETNDNHQQCKNKQNTLHNNRLIRPPMEWSTCEVAASWSISRPILFISVVPVFRSSLLSIFVTLSSS